MIYLKSIPRWIDLLWLVLLSGWILAGVGIVPFHGDESTLIYMGRDSYYQFVQRDLSLVTYSDPPLSATEQHLRLLNGTIPKYLFGIAAILGGYDIDEINEQWDWGADWEYNLQNGHFPPEDLLLRARILSALMLSGAAAVLFILADQTEGRFSAYLASLYFVLNPAVLLNGRRTMMEGGMLLMSLLVVLAGVIFLRRPSARRLILLALLSGLALATKHTTLFTVAAVWSACALVLIYRSVRTKSIRLSWSIGALIAGAGISFGVFYLLNPAWWGDPLNRAREVLSLRTELLSGQAEFFGGYASFADQLGGFLRQTLIVHPQYFEAAAWQDDLGAQITVYEASLLRGISLGGSVIGAIGLLILIIFGVIALLHRPDKSGLRWVIGLWALSVLLTSLVLTPLEWQRYYLPAYPVVGFLSAKGAMILISLLKKPDGEG